MSKRELYGGAFRNRQDMASLSSNGHQVPTASIDDGLFLLTSTAIQKYVSSARLVHTLALERLSDASR